MENWYEIPEFPGYSVSDHGRVRNDDTGRMLSLQKNQRDVIYVPLSRDRLQFNRPVATLVASAFVDVPFNNHDLFNSVVHLDADRTNIHVTNLVWRPRWFGIAYYKQFTNEWRGYTVPIENLDTGEVFKNSWAASTHYGLLEKRLVISMVHKEPVWPTLHRYRL